MLDRGSDGAIFDGLEWLVLAGDKPAVFQLSRSARHAEVAHQLLAAGRAYRCYLTPEDLAERRQAAQAERRPFRIESEWRDAGPARWPEGQPYVVRIRAPREGETVIDDLIRGRITVSNAEIDDFIILRSDGSPTYMLAVAVDDHDMGVSHVIRGGDHINNAFRQLVIIRAMQATEGEWPDPVYAHIPLIHGADGAKLSKRHGALGVDAYRGELAILPEALFNYLLRLGWGHGDDEIISREQAMEWFDITDVGKSPSRFDPAKLPNLNGHYLRKADDARLAKLAAIRMAVAPPLGHILRHGSNDGRAAVHGAGSGSRQPAMAQPTCSMWLRDCVRAQASLLSVRKISSLRGSLGPSQRTWAM